MGIAQSKQSQDFVPLALIATKEDKKIGSSCSPEAHKLVTGKEGAFCDGCDNTAEDVHQLDSTITPTVVEYTSKDKLMNKFKRKPAMVDS